MCASTKKTSWRGVRAGSVFPLWREQPDAEFVQEMLAAGLKARIVFVDPEEASEGVCRAESG